MANRHFVPFFTNQTVPLQALARTGKDSPRVQNLDRPVLCVDDVVHRIWCHTYESLNEERESRHAEKASVMNSGPVS